MKKFTATSVIAMGLLTIASAAFAGTSKVSSRGFVAQAAADTVVPADTACPNRAESAPALCMTDTVLPTDTVCPQRHEAGIMLADTVAPTDTVTPQN